MRIAYRAVSYSEALVLQSKLHAYGIETNFMAFHYSTFDMIMCFMSNCNLEVADSDYELAQEIIFDINSDYEIENPILTCNKCNSHDVIRLGSIFPLIMLVLMIFGVKQPVPPGRTCRCNACGYIGFKPFTKSNGLLEKLYGFIISTSILTVIVITTFFAIAKLNCEYNDSYIACSAIQSFSTI